MATCPRCGGFLDEQHRCSGIWRLRLRAGRDVLLGGLVGGTGGWLFLTVVNGQPSLASIVVTALLGMALVLAWQRT
jgi:hypothetical protein